MLHNYKGENNMPPKFKFKKDEITEKAVEVIRKKGISGLTARSLAEELGCSAKPIFGLFKNMQEVKDSALLSADKICGEFMDIEMKSDKYPPYKAFGMAYIRFSSEEKELFKYLYMRDRTGENIGRDEKTEESIEILQKNLGFDRDTAYRFHLEMWIYVHGIASMIATGYLKWDMDFVSQALTDCFEGLKYRFASTSEKH